MNLKIIFEDEYIIVCYKPAGIPTQTSKLGEQDMVSLLKNYLYKQQAEDKQGGRITAAHSQARKKEPYLAVIHRLDQPVEGLLVFAKTPMAAKELSKQMQGMAENKQEQSKQGSGRMKTLEDAGFGKYYKAVLWGVPKELTGTLEDYLVKDGRTNTSRVCDKNEKDAKKAVLHYEVLVAGKDDEKVGKVNNCPGKNEIATRDISLVKIKLATGRHHQIRVQMANMGCPIWGDAKYNTAPVQDRRFRQIALCAYKLEFVHPKTKKAVVFEREPEGEGFRKL